MRSKYGTYKEYHTSLDNFDFVSIKGLRGGFKILKESIKNLDSSLITRPKFLCEPHLSKYKLYMGTTILCAIIFLVVKYFEYSHKIHEGFVPSHDTYMALYFTLTGLHGLHIVGGIVVLAYLLGPGISMWNSEPERFTNRIEIAGLYWHFVDLVWIFLFPILYLLN